MDFYVGIKGKDFVMVCCDTSATHSIIRIKQDEDKIIPINDHNVFCLSGEAGDRVNFTEYVIANVKLYALRNGVNLTTKGIANYTRHELAVALRKAPYHCNLLLAGYDEKNGPSLYWLDYLASLTKVNVGGTGYGSYFTLSMFDKMWHPELTPEEAVVMLDKGIEEVKKRLVVAPPSFIIKIIDKDGVRVVKTV
nr:proteasome subunit beta type-2 (PBD2) [Polytomella parva]|eukprot:CAMPEP_0175040884 /NCGR_PEP_ID=MMETSP0052_2-20121109/1555_1 /TAXON_ID=51329 ORGANISM="Polytomella parva, Strain SAG 63-3" /NCGR_SAMPLE_ID=MMETSP0052_2 /ASSEMBLY_ACC=CAM_ASM_000194 /LENGTH=193 /DNA_ID=CAMNT_0016303233 /DNA_START=102 /DNA_END=683 /DNA_ORIENTATION=+